jgi:ABC-type sugar transport system permease subunit
MNHKKRQMLYGYGFIGIWLIGFILLTLIPLIRSIIFSLSDVSITGNEGIVTYPIGFDHFINILTTDVTFIDEILSFLSEMILYVPVILILSMMIAMMLNQKIKFRALFRGIFFLPVIIVSGPVINELLNQGAGSVPLIEQYGMLDTIGEILPSFLAQPLQSLLSEMIMVLWFSGVQIVLFLAGLQKMSGEVYEAAQIDGASPWETFWKITLPSLRNIMVVAAIYTVVMLSTFSNNKVLGLIRQMMFASNGGYGYASAMSWLYFILISILLVIVVLIIAPKEKVKRVKGGKHHANQHAKNKKRL